MTTATDVIFSGCDMIVSLSDGRTAIVPYSKYPILRTATARQRNAWKLAVHGTALRWEEIDEDISVDGILRAPETQVLTSTSPKRG